MRIKEKGHLKAIISEEFNLIFDKRTGYTCTWGKDQNDDPDYCQYGPIIADIEISTICNLNCYYCYKDNNHIGQNMSFEIFKAIFHKLPRTLTQIAFGIGSIKGCPDLWDILRYCRNNDYQYIIPNLTINGRDISDQEYSDLAYICGAIAVSNHIEDDCFNAVKKLTDRGMTQVNIHQVICEETFESCMNLIDQVKTDSRLEKLNAVVFLHLKPKGRGGKLHKISDENYKLFIEKLFESGINFGMDSCGSGRLLNYINENYKDKTNIHGHHIDDIKQYITPCESTRESSYINVEGKFFPCSFTEDNDSFKEGIDVTKVKDFVEEVWMCEQTNQWRQNLLSKCNNCPIYKI